MTEAGLAWTFVALACVMIVASAVLLLRSHKPVPPDPPLGRVPAPWVATDGLHYVDRDGLERRLVGAPTGRTFRWGLGRAQIWDEAEQPRPVGPPKGNIELHREFARERIDEANRKGRKS